MQIAEVERVVREAAQVDGVAPLLVDSWRDRGGVHLVLRLASPGDAVAGFRSAELWTSGAEAFFLDVDDEFTLVEFEYDEDDQPALVHQLVSVACEYLLGSFREVEELGPRGRVRRHLVVVVDGEEHWLAHWPDRRLLPALQDWLDARVRPLVRRRRTLRVGHR